MAPRPVVCLMAEGAAVDQITGRLTAFNMLDVVLAQSFPAAIGRLMVINIYEIDTAPEKFFERVHILDPGGSAISSTDAVEIFAAPDQTHRALSAFWRVPLKAPGHYNVVVEIAPTKNGPWERVLQRRLTAKAQSHPLFGKPPADVTKGPGPTSRAV